MIPGDIFSYRAAKDGRVFLYWNGKEVMVVKGVRARRLLQKIEGASDEAAQLAMAKITGNFKRGNERPQKKAIKKQRRLPLLFSAAPMKALPAFGRAP